MQENVQKLLKRYKLPLIDSITIKKKQDIFKKKLIFPLLLYPLYKKNLDKKEIIVKKQKDFSDIIKGLSLDKNITGFVLKNYIEGITLSLSIKKDETFERYAVLTIENPLSKVYKDISYSLLPIDKTLAEQFLKNLKAFGSLKFLEDNNSEHFSSFMSKISKLAEEKKLPDISFKIILGKSSCTIIEAEVLR